MRRAFRLIAAAALCAFVFPAAAPQTLPCDLAPAPVLCYGTISLKTGYAGNAFDLVRPGTGATTTIGYTSAGALDSAALDAFNGGTLGRVNRWYDQAGNSNLENQRDITLTGTTTNGLRTVAFASTATLAARDHVDGPGISFSTNIQSVDSGVQITMNQPATASGTVSLRFSQAPMIETLVIGTARSVVFNGLSMSGALFGLKTATDITSLGVTAQDYSIVSVVRFSSSLATNQAGAPGVDAGALAELSSGAGVVSRVINNSILGRGVFQVTDGAFDFKTNGPPGRGYTVPVTPIVLGITSDSTGVKVWINGEVRATASRSALTRTAATLWLGKLASSVAGATSKAGQFEVVAHLVYNVGLTQAQYGFVASALYSAFTLKSPTLSTYNSNYLTNFSDSIGAGYVTDGTKGYMAWLQDLLTKPVVVGSHAVPGSTNMQNAGSSAIPPSHQAGIVYPALCESMRYYKKNRVVIIHVAGNDVFLGPVIRTGNTHSSTLIDNIGSTADLTVGDFVTVSGLTTLQTIQSKTANSITLTGAVSTTLTGVNIIFTFANRGPTPQRTNFNSMVTQASACGATHIYAVPTLKRADGTQPWIDAVNSAITTGPSGYVVIDCRAFGNLGTNPGVDYADTGHMTLAGQVDMAQCLSSTIDAALLP